MSHLSSDSFTDKPISLSIKDYIIRKMAVKMMLSEKLIFAVVTHQFNSANNALERNKSVEISGFGKFHFNNKKANTLMAKFESQKALFEKMANDETLTEAKRKSARMKLETAISSIRDLKPKIYNNDFEDLRGMEEQSSPTQEAEELNKED